MVIYRSYLLKLNKQIQTVKLPSVTCLKVKDLFLNGKIEWWNGNFYIGNYSISFTTYVKSKILKLQITSNQWSFDSNKPPKWKKSVYSSNCHPLPICTIKQVSVNTNRSSLSSINIRVQFESQKHIFQMAFESLKRQNMFGNWLMEMYILNKNSTKIEQVHVF